MGPNLSSIKIFQGTCGCMLCWVFFIVHVMSWLHRAMPLCSTTSKRVPPKITIGCFGLCTAQGCWASQHFLHALVSAWAQRRHALPPGCNSLPCRIPPAALTEASSSSQGIFYIIRATGRSLVMNMPREAQSFMQAGPLALKHGSVTSWLSLSRVYSRWISRRPPQFCDQTHCRRPSSWSFSFWQLAWLMQRPMVMMGWSMATLWRSWSKQVRWWWGSLLKTKILAKWE